MSSLSLNLSMPEAVKAQHLQKEGDLAQTVAISTQSCNALIGIALFVIGCVAAAGAMNGVTIGWCIVGLSIPSLIGYVIGAIAGRTPGEKAANAIPLLITIALIVIGALAVAGIVTPVVAGWCVIGPTLAILAIGIVCCYCCAPCACMALAGAER